MIFKTCLFCGKEFEVKKAKQTYCSVKCVYKGRSFPVKKKSSYYKLFVKTEEKMCVECRRMMLINEGEEVCLECVITKKVKNGEIRKRKTT